MTANRRTYRDAAGTTFVPENLGWRLVQDYRPLGWVYHCSDGAWIADRGNGDYLPGEFRTRDEAVAALERKG